MNTLKSMSEELARTILAGSVRDEVADHAFGDSEYLWRDVMGKEVASGYSGRSGTDVTVNATEEYASTTFNGPGLVDLGKRGRFARNDGGDE